MVILRDDEKISKLKRRSRTVSLIGLLVLAGGFIILFLPSQNELSLIPLQLLALFIGFLISQYGIYLANRFARTPRPDEVLDDAFKSVVKDGRMYHYLLPADHVLLTKYGIIVIVPKYQGGHISAEGDTWHQTGISLRGRIFGQERLGNPSKDADRTVAALMKYISRNAPEVEEINVAPMIVFTGKNVESLDTDKSNIPALHYSKVKGFLRQKGTDDLMTQEDYVAIRNAFDKTAEHLS